MLHCYVLSILLVFFVVFLIMDIASTSTRKASKDILGDWADRDILRTIYAFVRDGILDQALIDEGLSSD